MTRRKLSGVAGDGSGDGWVRMPEAGEPALVSIQVWNGDRWRAALPHEVAAIAARRAIRLAADAYMAARQ